MLLEPPFSLNGSDYNPALPPRWRQMKCAFFDDFVTRSYFDTRLSGMHAVCNDYPFLFNLTINRVPWHLQEKILVTLHASILCDSQAHVSFLGSVYSGTRMDTIWSLREG